VWAVAVNGDAALDLKGKTATPGSTKKILGVILILAINLVGIAIIFRIWKKETEILSCLKILYRAGADEFRAEDGGQSKLLFSAPLFTQRVDGP
jgi:hypothetical protein